MAYSDAFSQVLYGLTDIAYTVDLCKQKTWPPLHFILFFLKVLWLVLKFFLLGTELSVIVFGIAFGKFYFPFFLLTL